MNILNIQNILVILNTLSIQNILDILNILNIPIIFDYIVDFVCLDRMLVVEVDGAYHAEREQVEDDEVRTARLEQIGFRVIRFGNEEVLYDIDNVLAKIKNELRK